MEFSSWAEVRSQRGYLIQRCDWTDLPHAALTDEQKTAWQTYRQALRDIPQTYQNINEIIWPQEPTGV